MLEHMRDIVKFCNMCGESFLGEDGEYKDPEPQAINLIGTYEDEPMVNSAVICMNCADKIEAENGPILNAGDLDFSPM
jgi:hypothetical protein